MGNLYLPSPRNQGWENGVLWLLCGFILDLGKVGGGGVGFAFAVPCYFVQDCSFQENCKYYVCASTIYKHSKSLYDTKHYCLLT